jgi:hypothetical protein
MTATLFISFTSAFRKLLSRLAVFLGILPQPAAPILMLPAPAQPIALLPAPSDSFYFKWRMEQRWARVRELRRNRVATYARGVHYTSLRPAIGLPAIMSRPFTPAPREMTATITMQQRMIAETGVGQDNPNKAWQSLMDAYLAKQAAKQSVQAAGGVS